MAAKDSGSKVSKCIFGGSQQKAPPASDKIVPAVRRLQQVSPKYRTIRSHLVEMRKLIEETCAVLKALRKLLVVLSTIIILIWVMWGYSKSHPSEFVVPKPLLTLLSRWM